VPPLAPPTARRARDSPASCRCRCRPAPAPDAGGRSRLRGANMRGLARIGALALALFGAFAGQRRAAPRPLRLVEFHLRGAGAVRALPPIRAGGRTASVRRAAAWRCAGRAPAPTASAAAPAIAARSTRPRARASRAFAQRQQRARRLLEQRGHGSSSGRLGRPSAWASPAGSARQKRAGWMKAKAPAGRAPTGRDSPAGWPPAAR
jgi:hypothetical protein